MDDGAWIDGRSRDDRLLHDLVERSYRLSFVNELLAGLPRCTDVAALRAQVVPPLLEITGATAAWLHAPGQHGGDDLPPGRDDAVATLRRGGPDAPWLGTAGTREGYLARCPLPAGERTIGELWLAGDPRREAPLLEAEGLLRPIAGQLGLALANLARLAEAREQAIRDGLTGLYNHAHFQRQLRAEFDRARRYGTGFSLVMVDVDHFKRLNDDYGHQAGDLVLREVGALVGGTMRVSDLAARYGGEEFVLLLPETPPEGAHRVAERLRAGIRALAPRTLAGRPLRPVTASFGVATHRPSDLDPQWALHRADEALYRAKRGGRDAIAAERPEPERTP
jgi:diguanylate cyclase (GGDEF)-like protein